MSSPMFDLPEHVKIGVTAEGKGPAIEFYDLDFDHYACWCGDPECEKWKP